ncbi:tight adherence protein B [Kribbella amoyensis]|uniref:Tight adherence protein B n=1 Tax=Kribbella amoyensis TaxID=996641 RepID=A0A561BQH4_9ACTN|nr:type II secretion system F family protein [Kribbella amoyensis]TWD81110.1 tight adherence protein B [Kribbella amoyensis]
MNDAVLAAVMTMLAVFGFLPRRGRGLHRLTAAAQRRPSTGATELARSSSRRLVPLAGLAVVAVAVGLSLGPGLVVACLALGVILFVVAGQRRAARRLSLAAERRTQVIEACDVLAADLTAGRPPHEALEGAATICPDLQVAATAARLGGDVPGVLRLSAETPGAEGLTSLAAAWRVAEESGAPFASITERLAATLRAEEAVRHQITTNLAGARTTARLLAVLPLFGTALGYALGANPLTFLTETPPGWLCLATGLALAITGLHWTNRLATPH